MWQFGEARPLRNQEHVVLAEAQGGTGDRRVGDRDSLCEKRLPRPDKLPRRESPFGNPLRYQEQAQDSWLWPLPGRGAQPSPPCWTRANSGRGGGGGEVEGCTTVPKVSSAVLRSRSPCVDHPTLPWGTLAVVC